MITIKINRQGFSDTEKDILAEHMEMLHGILCKYLGAYNPRDGICHCVDCRVETLCKLYTELYDEAISEE